MNITLEDIKETTPKQTMPEQLERQKQLNNITNKIHSATDTESILLNLQQEILSLLDAERITVYTVNGIKKQIVSKFKSGDDIDEIRVPINSKSIAGYCAWSGKTINIPDVYNQQELLQIDPQLEFDKTWDQKTGYKTKNLLATPIIYKRFILGVVQLINKKNQDGFTEEDTSSLHNIANVLGIAFFKNQKTDQKIDPTKFDYLIKNDIISRKNLTNAMSLARKMKHSVESELKRTFNVSGKDIGKSLSDFYKTRYISFDDRMVIPGQLLKGLKPEFLRYNNFVPIEQKGAKTVVAMENPNFLPARDVIARIIPAKEYEYCASTKDDINKIIDLFFNVTPKSTLTDTVSIESILGQLEPGEEDLEEDYSVTEEDSTIVQLINKVIIDAYNRGASDIHIEPRPGRAHAVIRIRIDGTCQIYQTIPHTYKKAIVSRIKIMSDLDIAEKRLPQDGKIKFKKFAPLDIELRVATIPTAGQVEDVVMRLLAAGEPIPIAKIGMSDRDSEAFLDSITKPYGIILVVGPTGSGKTTTLHSAMKHINRPEIKIWTAEDPVEITQDGLRQVQVLPKIGFDFARAMRSFLRADPDVIMVGEMRDSETVSTGIEASLTGHLVFSTLHTNSAPETITRLLDMGMDPFNFADAILGILAQRLAKTLCSECKEKYHPTRNEFDILVKSYDGDFDALGYQYNEDFFLYRPSGCSHCNQTGYRGRMGLFELLLGTDELKSLIQSRARMTELRKQAIKDGMCTLMQDGIRKVCLGLTDLNQVRSVCIK
jgi:type II secretory ATPase GspE/PulE/Tfp pilus assembly ATPase PilB-like protein